MPYAKRDILSGYPKEFVFQSRADIENYFAGERVRCLLCGRDFRILDTHLRRVHSLTSDDFRERYGIPYLRGLCGSSFSEQRTEHGRTIWADNTERQAAALAKAKGVQTATGTNPQRGKPHFWRAERTGNGATHKKLSEAQVAEIKAARIGGETLVSIGCRYKVTASNVKMIVHGKTWKSVRPAL